MSKNRIHRQAELSKTLEFLDRIIGESGDFRQRVLIALSEIFNYHQSTFFIADDYSRLINPVTFNIEAKYVAKYRDYYHVTDIFNPEKHAALYLKKNVLAITDIMSYSQYEQTEYYIDFLKNQNIYYELAVTLHEGVKIIGAIGLFRPKKEGFAAAEINRLATLSKYISGILQKNLAIEKAQHYNKILEQSNQHSGGGTVIFTKDFSIAYVNAPAKELIQELFAAKVRPANLVAEFVKEVTNSLGTKWVQGGMKSLFSSACKEYLLQITPLDNTFNYHQSYYLLTIAPEKLSTKKLSASKLAGQFQLSARELEVLALVMKGLTNQEIAASLFITTHTVKTHLQRIFKKLAVSNRTELGHKVNVLQGKG